MKQTAAPDTLPVSPSSKVKSIKKLANGDMECTQHSGNVFVIKAQDRSLQAWIVFSMLQNS